MTTNSKRKGRRGGLQEARELIALLGALAQEGDTVDAAVISKRLGITLSDAQKLMMLLETVGVDTYTPLSLYSNADGTLSVAFNNGIHGAPLRLSKPETVALNAALNYLQIPPEDTLRLKINEALGNQEISIKSIERAIAPAESAPIENNLRTIARAIANQRRLSFYYKGNTDEVPNKRVVIPLYIKHDDNTWLLQANDLRRNAERTFRVDRISSCSTESIPPDTGANVGDGAQTISADKVQAGIDASESPESTPSTGTTKLVTLNIFDESVLQEFSWPGLEVVSRDDSCITATIPYYGDHSPWLPRVLAACGRRIHCSDSHINELRRIYAREQIALGDAQ